MAKAKILLIDDDTDYLVSTRALLESKSYEVSCAESGAEGLEMIKSYHPDLIILDIMMESIFEGYNVNQALRFREEFKAFRHIPIIMISAVQDDPASRFQFADGQVGMITPDSYLTKPLQIDAFLENVENLLADK